MLEELLADEHQRQRDHDEQEHRGHRTAQEIHQRPGEECAGEDAQVFQPARNIRQELAVDRGCQHLGMHLHAAHAPHRSHVEILGMGCHIADQHDLVLEDCATLEVVLPQVGHKDLMQRIRRIRTGIAEARVVPRVILGRQIHLAHGPQHRRDDRVHQVQVREFGAVRILVAHGAMVASPAHHLVGIRPVIDEADVGRRRIDVRHEAVPGFLQHGHDAIEPQGFGEVSPQQHLAGILGEHLFEGLIALGVLAGRAGEDQVEKHALGPGVHQAADHLGINTTGKGPALLHQLQGSGFLYVLRPGGLQLQRGVVDAEHDHLRVQRCGRGMAVDVVLQAPLQHLQRLRDAFGQQRAKNEHQHRRRGKEQQHQGALAGQALGFLHGARSVRKPCQHDKSFLSGWPPAQDRKVSSPHAPRAGPGWLCR